MACSGCHRIRRVFGTKKAPTPDDRGGLTPWNIPLAISLLAICLGLVVLGIRG